MDAQHGPARFQRCVTGLPELIDWKETRPTFRFVEFFAGKMQLTPACVKHSFVGWAFDKDLNPASDLRTVGGFVLAYLMCIKVVPGGLVWWAPQCSTWQSFMSAANHQRRESNGWWGNQSRQDVLDANVTCQVMVFLIGLCTARCVRTVVENPAGSNLFKWGPMARRATDCGMRLYRTYGGAFGWKSLKPFQLLSNLPRVVVEEFLVRTQPQAREAMKAASGGRSPIKCYKNQKRRRVQASGRLPVPAC